MERLDELKQANLFASAMGRKKKTRGESLLERLKNGESLVVAEGYIFEFERRGYLQAGTFVPEVVLEHPDLVKSLHEEFVHAGSDVVLAFTYYAHREKMALVGLEGRLEEINKKALKIARDVADATGTLMAGNICNSTVYRRENEHAIGKTKQMFKEQVEWAVDGGADFIVGETYHELGEALLALEAIKKYGKGLPAVITFSVPVANVTTDDIPIGKACRKLEEAGADVVGLNCGKGPSTIIEPLKLIRESCKGPIAALPVLYRTNEDQPTFFSLTVPGTDIMAFPLNLHSCYSTRDEVRKFAEECKDIGVEYVGLCCGNSSNLLRIVAEVYDKQAPAIKYSPKMKDHYIFGDKDKFDDYNTVSLKGSLVK